MCKLFKLIAYSLVDNYIMRLPAVLNRIADDLVRRRICLDHDGSAVELFAAYI